jgi:hypothetical protein
MPDTVPSPNSAPSASTCASCGAPMASDALYCSRCGRAKAPPPGNPAPGAAGAKGDTIESLAREATRAAKELVSAAVTFSEKAGRTAGHIAEDPKGSMKKGLHKVRTELDATTRELDELLKKLD